MSSSFSLRRSSACAAIALMLLACRHHVEAARGDPLPPAWPGDSHCWWTAVRTSLPVDSVGHRFSRAFASLGLGDVTATRIGDTVLVRGGPTELGGTDQRAQYASRMVAYQRRDSTSFRWYWSITPVAGGRATSEDSASVTGRGIGFCGDIGKKVSIQGWASREPTHDDSLAVWGRLP
jgi:hypothetical protein